MRNALSIPIGSLSDGETAETSPAGQGGRSRKGANGVEHVAPRATVEPELTDRNGLAVMLDISVSTLDRLSASGKVPRPIKFGRSSGIRWRISTVRAWLSASEQAGRLLTRAEWETIQAGTAQSTAKS
ncbi:MAG: hypothetical protein IT428_15750 [Planctomycetaceae bacterium]|nr:hypothetical protein [Planctomycetaceae bacterium]